MYSLSEDLLPKGSQVFSVNAGDWMSGVYCVVLRAGAETVMRKVVCLK